VLVAAIAVWLIFVLIPARYILLAVGLFEFGFSNDGRGSPTATISSRSSDR
jgi:hypothetical protein